jgi:hypothetical protein
LLRHLRPSIKQMAAQGSIGRRIVDVGLSKN